MILGDKNLLLVLKSEVRNSLRRINRADVSNDIYSETCYLYGLRKRIAALEKRVSKQAKYVVCSSCCGTFAGIKKELAICSTCDNTGLVLERNKHV